MPKVLISGSTCRQFIGEISEIEVTADTFGRLVRELDQRFPGLGHHVAEFMAVAIDGVIFQDAHSEKLPEHAEIVLIPKIGAG
jgi:molybdopterin converting factor small subunit